MLYVFNLRNGNIRRHCAYWLRTPASMIKLHFAGSRVPFSLIPSFYTNDSCWNSGKFYIGIIFARGYSFDDNSRYFVLVTGRYVYPNSGYKQSLIYI